MFIADFHIHSKYSRATSRECVAEVLELWGRRKGIDVIGTGDFTHPAWREELKEKLVPSADGLYVLKDDFRQKDMVAGENLEPRFIVTGEISSIYKKNGRVRKVHNLILLPSLEHAEALSRRLEAIGNLHSDGRPILGLDSRDLLEIVLDTCEDAIFIPAHVWTPHFSLYGAYSGFDHIQECFEDLTGHIYALESGLSSDPPMNWRLSALDGFTLVSNSDAHSPAKLGREANIFDTTLSYQGISQALKNRGTNEFFGTIEFFPEEGKYHYDGHRNCKVCWKPDETKAAQGICPVCGGKITVGVLHRVEELADREEGFVLSTAKHFESLVPLQEIIASSIGSGVTSKKVVDTYENLIRSIGPELHILRKATLPDIESVAGPWVAEGIRRLRCGQVERQPGFDGEYGKITVIDNAEIARISGQLSIFSDQSDKQPNPSIPQTKKKVKTSAQQEAEQFPITRGFEEPPHPEPLPFKEGEGRFDVVTKASVTAETPYGLNNEQWEAVSSSSPAIAVVAGPGTGKTRTLVYRIAHLVEKCGVRPDQITAVTFTNKAAQEMRVRLEKHFGDKRATNAMTIGTFHSICLQMLSQWRGENSPAIIDEYDALAIIEEIVKDMQLDLPPRDVMRMISLRKNRISPVGDKANEPTQGGESSSRRDVLPAQLYDAYCAQLKRYGVMDYDDILLEVLCRFEDGSALDGTGLNGANPFSHLLVDEFQDINEIQYRLIKAWARQSESVFVIGDPDQSIYGFRGSDLRYYSLFEEDFPGLQQVRLTQNYRSTPEIIACARSLISRKNDGEYRVVLEANKARGGRVRLIETRNDFSEALFVAKEINRMVGGIDMLDTQALSPSRSKRSGAKHPRGFSDIALLYRTNHQARILEQCLSTEGIPYLVAGREEYLADKSVRQALAFFKFLLNPGDTASLLLCLKAETNYSADLIQKIIEGYTAGGKGVESLARIIEEAQRPPLEQPGQPVSFVEMLRKYAAIIRKEKPKQIVDIWIDDHNLSDSDPMVLLSNIAIMYDDMPTLMQNLVLGRESDVVRSGGKVYAPDAVSLMTIHAAKGLEFPVVFICGVNDGRIPLRNNRNNSDIDEERRLFYVAITRAQDELILLTYRNPSPFIADLSEEQLIREEAFAPKQAPQYRQATLF
ncbi:MAG: UvrD-helicase domain-containing protein [Chloroflexota bacterium]|jgi:uncharacterized protein (TIGR00375 family)